MLSPFLKQHPQAPPAVPPSSSLCDTLQAVQSIERPITLCTTVGRSVRVVLNAMAGAACGSKLQLLVCFSLFSEGLAVRGCPVH